MRFIIMFLLGLVIGWIAASWPGTGDPDPNIHPGSDTLIAAPMAPDTVIIEKVDVKYITRYRTVYRDTGKVIIRRDTVYLDTTLNRYTSMKMFHWPYVNSFITTYSLCPVDSIQNNVVVDWDSYTQQNLIPIWQKEARNIRNKGRMEGVVVGIIGTLLVAKAIK